MLLLITYQSFSAPQNSGFNFKERESMEHSTEMTSSNSLLILDEQTFAPKWSYFLDNNEVGQTILSATLGDETRPYIILGTAYCHPDETESKSGRIIVFNWTDDGKVKSHFKFEQSCSANPILVFFKKE